MTSAPPKLAPIDLAYRILLAQGWPEHHVRETLLEIHRRCVESHGIGSATAQYYLTGWKNEWGDDPPPAEPPPRPKPIEGIPSWRLGSVDPFYHPVLRELLLKVDPKMVERYDARERKLANTRGRDKEKKLRSYLISLRAMARRLLLHTRVEHDRLTGDYFLREMVN